MIKSVLSALPVFSMACLRLSVAVEDELTSLMRNFLWNGSDDKGKFPLIAWKKICQPKMAGGAGIHQISIMNLAMGANLVWEIYSGVKKNWARLMKHKYLDSLEPKRILTINNPPRGSAIWNFILDSREFISD